MSTRLIRATLLGLTLILMRAPAALAHGGGTDDGRIFSWDSLPLAFITSFLVWLICFAVMVWDPQGGRK